MSTGNDISRGRKLTAAEAAHYKNIRRQIMEEIPPATSNIVVDAIAALPGGTGAAPG